MQLQGLTFSWVIAPRSVRVKVVSERALWLGRSPSLSEFGNRQPQVSAWFDCGDEVSRFSHPLNS